ncbi:MAG TPA: hypothetical protein VKX46_03680 [Ktedonobacteraceae bacterium]|nr:hypothetical protein [Ktedonobacteraceae bacterium]
MRHVDFLMGENRRTADLYMAYLQQHSQGAVRTIIADAAASALTSVARHHATNAWLSHKHQLEADLLHLGANYAKLERERLELHHEWEVLELQIQEARLHF